MDLPHLQQEKIIPSAASFHYKPESDVRYEDEYWKFDIIDIISLVMPNIKNHALL
jgi:hypothetical protein